MDGRDEKTDLVAAFGVPLFFGLWCVTGWWAIISHPYLRLDFGLDPGPDLMPVIVLSLLSAGSLAMLARALVLWARGRGTTRTSLFGSIAIPFAFAASLLALVPAMRWAGFLPAGLVFAFGWMLTRVNGLAVGAADVPHHPRLPSEGPGAG